MHNTAHLSTEAYGSVWDERVNRSVPGMAHFALTGPSGTWCLQCKLWGRSNAFKRDDKHRLRRRTCQKFLKMYQTDCGPAIDPETPSCRYFDAREVSPLLVKPPKPKVARPVKAKG